MVTTQIAQKCLEILLLSYRLHILAPDQMKLEKQRNVFAFFFLATFNFSNCRYKKQLLTFLEQLLTTFCEISVNFLENLGQLVANPTKLILNSWCRLHSIVRD